MRWLFLFASIAWLAACVSVEATRSSSGPPPPTPPIFNSPEAAGRVEILETQGEKGVVVVGYENTTAMTLRSVTIRCRGFDAAGFQSGVSDILIDGASEGPIVPGFKIRRSTQLFGLSSKITCGVTAAEADR